LNAGPGREFSRTFLLAHVGSSATSWSALAGILASSAALRNCMRNADGQVPPQTRRAALPAVRMNELDKFERDEESPEGLSGVTVSTLVVPASSPLGWIAVRKDISHDRSRSDETGSLTVAAR
jgi:hypothetical protein